MAKLGFVFGVLVFVLSGSFNTASACAFNCGSTDIIPQKDPGGPAVKYGNSAFAAEIPEREKPNDATISLYEDGRREFFESFKSRGFMHTIWSLN